MIIQLKHQVVLVATTDLKAAIGWVGRAWQMWPYDLGPYIVTSVKDGDHSVDSQHKQNKPDEEEAEAADIRTRHLWDGPLYRDPDDPPWKDLGKHHIEVIKFAKFLQREGLAVVVHPDWVDGYPHIHFGTKTPIFERVD